VKSSPHMTHLRAIRVRWLASSLFNQFPSSLSEPHATHATTCGPPVASDSQQLAAEQAKAHERGERAGPGGWHRRQEVYVQPAVLEFFLRINLHPVKSKVSVDLPAKKSRLQIPRKCLECQSKQSPITNHQSPSLSVHEEEGSD
jgi:hypothetical protein